MTQKQFETIKLRLETEHEKLEKLYKDTFPFNVKAAYVTCRECGSKISTEVMKKRRSCDKEQACPVCSSFKGLYSVTASERIAKAKARCSKADKAFAEAKKKLDVTAAKNPVINLSRLWMMSWKALKSYMMSIKPLTSLK